MADSVVPADGGATHGKKKKGRRVWRVVFWLALIVFLCSISALGYLMYTYWEGQHDYDEIASVAFPDGSATPVPAAEEASAGGPTLADMTVDWDALRAINPEVVAWVYLPDTVVNYPVAHKSGDSDYYLHHNFSLGEGKFGAEYGSIMLSGDNSGDFSDQVNIIFGHHMRNGSMFALFGDFYESDVFNQHRTIYLLTPKGNYRLESFAVVHVPMGHGDVGTPNYATEQEFGDFKQWVLDNSVVKPDPDTSDTVPASTQLFGFCTCDGADNTWRYITFTNVAEFVPIDQVGTGTYQGTGEVSGEDIDTVQGDVQERADG